MANLLMGQTAKNYVIQVEGESVYVDVTTAKIGDRFSVFKEGEYFTHPVTKKKILRDPIRVADIEIIDISEGYSVAKAIPPQAISLLKVGMTVYPATKDTTRTANTPGTANSNAIPVIIAPAQVNDVVGIGHFGGYVADMLMEQLLRCNKVRLLDRSVLAAQMDEVDLAGDYIDPMTAIQRGKIAGARYILQVTMQKPDVVNVSTGIPLASIMGAVQGAVGKNIGAQYMSNARMENLKASVNISTRVVDLQTGEVVFMCSGSGNAKGKVQMSLEYGALGGAEINGGVDGFKQTVTGKAIQKAFIVIGQHLNKYFNGETTQKVV